MVWVLNSVFYVDLVAPETIKHIYVRAYSVGVEAMALASAKAKNSTREQVEQNK